MREGLALWYARLGDAWDEWGAEMDAYRARLAALLGAARSDCIVPKASAGQGLRAVLNTYDRAPRVVATRGEFDSLDVILREYARRGRISLAFVEPREDGDFPVDVAALGVDFAVGGTYKYLRGGPGACFLYVAPRHLDGGLATLDIGWFAKESPFLVAERGIEARGGTVDRGAFVVVRARAARAWSEALESRGITTDARGEWLRLTPDVLTTEAELEAAAAAIGDIASE